MMELLSADVEGMSREEEMYSRRGALKLLLMNQARMIEANKVVTTLPPPPPILWPWVVLRFMFSPAAAHPVGRIVLTRLAHFRRIVTGLACSCATGQPSLG